MRAPIKWDRDHVRYSDQRALVSIRELDVLNGTLSPKVLRMVREWASLHREELEEDWRLARAEVQLRPIAPLE